MATKPETIPTYTADCARRLILDRRVAGEFHVTGWLDLRGCDLTGVTLPTTVTGSLDLSGCDLTGVTLPTTVTGSLDLRKSRNLSTPSSSWVEGGEATPRRCLAISDYALIKVGAKYIAGCRGPWTAKQALAHWGSPLRTDDRAKLFVAAIKAAEAFA